MRKIRIYGRNASREYEGIEVEFINRTQSGNGLAILTAATGEKAKVIAAFAGPGGARTTDPDEIFIQTVIEGRDSFPYLWAL